VKKFSVAAVCVCALLGLAPVGGRWLSHLRTRGSGHGDGGAFVAVANDPRRSSTTRPASPSSRHPGLGRHHPDLFAFS
jgi:hypothetical protein